MHKVAFLHYHLKPGGVTRVIEQQLDALEGNAECMVITGERPLKTPEDTPTIIVPSFAYDYIKEQKSPIETANEIAASIKKIWPDGCDVLHAHNPTLAKNKYVSEILQHLQKKGLKLFLQIHDFAEDGRPLSYSKTPYPSNCHYGCINSRDREILLNSGLTEKGLHDIPNMISLPEETNGEEKSISNLILYPVRGIRRKNLGEALLLSLFLDKKSSIGITLPPLHGQQVKSYNDWKEFSSQYELKIHFDLGLRFTFTELMSSAEAIITTSVTEGFGFCFLEAWTWDKFLCGRQIPSICKDFESKGINLSHMYSSFKIPLSWIAEEYLDTLQNVVNETAKIYSYKLPKIYLTNYKKQIEKDASVDFGLLNEILQKEIIIQLINDNKKRKALINLNPWLRNFCQTKNTKDLIKKNKQSIFVNYSENAYSKRLLNIYDQVRQNDVKQNINKTKLLEQFFHLDNFHLLKWQIYEKEN